MGRITSGIGLVSGINSSDIIDQLMKLESKPKDLLQARIDGANQRKLAYADLVTRLSGLRVTAQSLKKPSAFQAATAASSDEDVLTATATAGAAVGTYQFQVARLVTTQQAVSGGFGDFDATPIGPTTLTIEQGGGELTSTNPLAQLNGGAGVRRGLFRITDRSGKSAVIDTTAAVNLDDVVKKINTSLDVSVRAKVDGDRLVLSDLSGSAAQDFTVQDLGDGHAAEDLGIAADVAGGTIGGRDINSIGAQTPLDGLNDGRGVRAAGGTTKDFRVTLRDGSTVDVALGAARTVGDVLKAINDAGGPKLKADVAAGANGIRLTDTTGGAGTLSVAALNNSNAAADLGIQTTSGSNVINGGPVLAGLGTVLVSSLRGGTGLPLGTIHLTDRSGGSADVDLSGARSVQDILDAINNATGVRVTASLKGSANGIQIADASGGSGDLTIDDVDSTTAQVLGLKGTFDASKPAAVGANLQRQWVSENTLLSSYNGGKGVSNGAFRITNSQGRAATIDLSDGKAVRLKDVIAKINAAGIGVTASVNANGDGLLLSDGAGGAAKLKVEEVDGTAAADLNIKGTATTGTTIDGSFEKTVTLAATDTLADVQTKINGLGFGATASIINDGTGATPYRLSLSARNTGRNGRVVFDAGTATGLQTRNLVEAQDAAVFLGSADAAEPLLITAGSNQLAGVVKGVNIDLHNVSNGPVSLSVSRSVDPLVDSLKKFADDFNGLADKLTELTGYDQDKQKAGLLLGDATAQTIETNLYAVFGGFLQSGGKFRVLADVGLKLGDGGKLQFDEDKFRSAYATDPDAVQNLFSTAPPGLTAATRVSTLNGGKGVRTAAAGGADLHISVKDGTAFDVSLAGVDTVGGVLAAINAASGGKVTASTDETGGRFTLKDNTTTGTAAFRVEATNGSLAAEDLGIRASGVGGGTINGAIVLSSATAPLPANGAGLAYLLERKLTQLIDPVDGAVTRQNKNLDAQTAQFQGRIDALDKLLTAKRTRLEQQFANMESVLAQLQTQQQALGSFQGVAPVTSAK